MKPQEKDSNKQEAKQQKVKTYGISLSTNDKVSMINNMATMLTAGIPILETVDSMLEDVKGGQKKILEVLAEDLRQGKQIHQSFAKFPKTFNPIMTNLLKASEEAGTLDTTLKDIVDNIRREAEFTDKVKSAMTYPIFIMIVFFGMMLLMLTFVIPRIATVFSRLRVTLPLPTKILIFISNLLMNNTIPIIIGAVVLVAALVFFYRYQKGLLISLLLKLPVVSQLAKEIDITQFSRSFYLLLSSGVPITSALELCENIVRKKEVHNTIAFCREYVSQGHKLSEAFKHHKKVIPIIVIKMTEAGEKTGSLDSSMKEASEFMDYQVSKTLKKLTTLMEPLMLVLVGIMIGGMMLAIIAPIYSLIGQVGSK